MVLGCPLHKMIRQIKDVGSQGVTLFVEEKSPKSEEV